MRALVRRGRPFAADQVEHRALPVAHGALDRVAQVRRRPVQPASPVGRAAARCRRRCVRHDVAARSAARSAAASTSSATPDSSAAVSSDAGLVRSAGDGRGEPVAQAADPVLQRAQQLPGADELLPAGQHLAAQQRAVAHAVVDLGERARVGRARRRRAAAPRRRSGRAPARRGRRCAGAGCPVRRRGCAGRRRRAAPASRARSDEPVAQRADDGLGQQAVVRAWSRGRRRAAPRPARARRASRRRCAAMSVLGARGHPVEQHGERGAALLGGLQHVPRHGVGVAGGRRDEQPQVGGGEQLRGEPPVRGDDRVDVGGVEEGEARDPATADVTSCSVRWSVPAPLVRVSSGSTRVSENQRRSSGWQTSTGERVVGPQHPGRRDLRRGPGCSRPSTCPRRWSRRRR